MRRGETSTNFYAPRPIVNAEVLRLDHPVFYGYTDKIMPIKYLGGPLLTVGEPYRANVLARYSGWGRGGGQRLDARRRRNSRASVRRSRCREASPAKDAW